MNNKSNPEQILESLRDYRHRAEGRVQFAEVDSLGVAHNLRYLYWLEWARTEYFRAIGADMSAELFIKKYPVMTVHAEADYFNPARFDDYYSVYTKVSRLGNSSMVFSNVITSGKKLLLTASAVLVHVNPITGESAPIPDELRQKIIDFEENSH
ncbi:MAG: acyl-CoA thioesterase [Bacteroidota bacterium]